MLLKRFPAPRHGGFCATTCIMTARRTWRPVKCRKLLWSSSDLEPLLGSAWGTFSTALVPPWRSAEHPEGLPALTPLQRDRVDRENNLAIFCAKLSAACEAAGLTYAVSNPLRSRMWRLPCWRRLLEPGRTFSVDFCRFSTPWRKATRIATNGQLAGQSLRCMHEGAHRALRDRCPKRGVNWTSLAEPCYALCLGQLWRRMPVFFLTGGDWTSRGARKWGSCVWGKLRIQGPARCSLGLRPA